jgi:uncharacterized delta-60 repeat protein
MNKQVLACLGLALVLGACAQPQPVQPLDPELSGFLGTLTLTVDGNAAPDLEFKPAGYPNAANIVFMPGLVTTAVSGTDRYVNMAFGVRNNTLATLQHLTLVAAHRSNATTTNLGGTAFSAINNAVAGTDTAALARSIMPTHGMLSTMGMLNTPLQANTNAANLQVFNPDQVAAFASQVPSGVLGTGEYLLGYGYLVRNTGNGFSIPGVGPARLTNRTNLTFKVPAASVTTSTTYTMQYLVFTDDTEALSQSLEEQRPPVLVEPFATKVAPQDSPDPERVAGYEGDNGETICKVRTAGPVGDPMALYLDAPLPSELAGSLDLCFGLRGRRITDFGANGSAALDVAIQADNKIVTAGVAANYSLGTSEDTYLARYTANGRLDKTFGTHGKVVLNLVSPNGASYDEARAVALQSDAKIVAVGRSGLTGTVLRLNANGSLDTSFASGGVFYMPNLPVMGETEFNDVTVVGSGASTKIIAVGEFEEYFDDSSVRAQGGVAPQASFYDRILVVRLNTNGTLDTSFGGGLGYVITARAAGGGYEGNAVAIDAAGKIVVAGSSTETGSEDSFALARYTTTGALDTSFGTGGVVETRMSTAMWSNDKGNAVAIDASGKIVVGGWAVTTNNYDFALARYTPAGVLDISFDTDGKVFTNFDSSNSSYDLLHDLAIDSSGKIVAVGQTNAAQGTSAALARYTTTGALDTSFDTDGLVAQEFDYQGGFADTELFGMAFQLNDGKQKIVVAGALDENFCGNSIAAQCSVKPIAPQSGISFDASIVGRFHP